MKQKPTPKKKPEPQPVVSTSKVSKRNIVIAVVVAVAALLLVKVIFFNKPDNFTSEETVIDSASMAKGKTLAMQYCQTCHLLPDPSLLDKTTWKSLLPEMGLRLGIQSPSVKFLAEQDKSFYPTHAALDAAQWQSILNYYDAAAPSSLAKQTNAVPVQKNMPFFSVLPVPEFLVRPNVIASYVKIDKTVSPARLFVFDAYARQLFLFNQEGLMDSLSVDGVITDISFYNNQIYACTIGKQMQMGPDNVKLGTVFPITISATGKLQAKTPLFKNLARPVQVVPADLNGDHRTDFLICEFGKLTGSLVWMEGKENGQYERHVIRDVPGSVKAYVKDNQHNGKPDLWVLFAQGDESIIHFKNKGDGTFTEEKVLRFPAIYGSTYFEMLDINKDGFEDIIYTCGDNGDGTRILKPYHGIYIFINDGKGKYEQKYFYAMNGCYKVIAKDFEGNGKINLAAISYFPDPDKPQEWFVYLKNDGGFNYTPYGPPPELNFEMVLTMDSGDFNGDGKPDLLFGNDFFSDGGAPKQPQPLFGLLESVSKQ